MPDDDRAYLSKRLDAEQCLAQTSPCAEPLMTSARIAEDQQVRAQSMLVGTREPEAAANHISQIP